MNEHHFSRIDAGQKRYKGQPDKPSQIEQPQNGKFLPSIAPELRPDILKQTLEAHGLGCSLRAIAEQIGVTHGTIRRWLLSDVPADYRKAQELGLVSRIVDTDEELESASDPLSVARAREAARFARWDAERRLPHLFGQKQEITHISADLGDRLRRARERVIEGEILPKEPKDPTDSK